MNKKTGRDNQVEGVIYSLRNAYRGLKYSFATQRNMAIHSIIGAVVIAAAIFLRVSFLEVAILVVVIALVVAAEILNTSLEKTIDLITRERNELAHIAKDTAAGAVLFAAILAVVTGLLILGPPLFDLVTNLLR